MRIAPPNGARRHPDPAAVEDALASATTAIVLEPDRSKRDAGQWLPRATLSGAALREVLGLLAFRTDVPPFDHWYTRPVMLEIRGDQREIARAELIGDGSLCVSPWGGYVELRRPSELFDALARAGAGTLALAWNAQHGPGAAEARRAFRAAVPAPLSAAYDPAWESLVPADLRGAALAQSMVPSLGREGAIEAILCWYGSGHGPLSLRPEYESLPRTLLTAFDFDTIVAVFPSLRGEAALAGAARVVLDASPMPPILASPVLALDEGVRRSLVAAARARMGEEDAERLSAELFPAPTEAPAEVVVLGHSATMRLAYPVSDGDSVYARDGKEIVRFAGGARTSLLPVLGPAVPMAFHDGALWLRFGDTVKKLSPGGDILEEVYGATDEERSAAAARLEQLGAPRLDGLPLSEAPFEAYVEYAHLGLPLPPSARVAHEVRIDAEGKAVVDGREIALPGRPVLWDVAASGAVVVLTEAASHGSAVVWLTEEGAPRVETGIDAAAVKALLAADRRAFLIVVGGRGLQVVAVPRR
jgi:hypothetical protein